MPSPLKPGATIGILGGGQLARMLALAAAPLGLRCHVYTPEKDSCALDVVHADTIGDYEDEAALARFAEAVDVVTYEFENVPAKTAAYLSKRRPVLPDPKVLETTQDRLIEKNFISALKIATAPYAPVHSATQLADGLAKVGVPAVLKTRTLGYDGKGQEKIAASSEGLPAWRRLKQVPCILEGFVNFQREVSVIAARSADGHVECFEVTENEHREHILHISRVPAKVTPALEAEARRVATRIVTAFDYVGVMGIEMFVVKRGREHHVLVNEVAPRVHNSGHWTIDGATVSQFEQHIRAVAGLPLAKPKRLGAKVEMRNLIGDEILSAGDYLTQPNTAVHIYGKGKPSPRRKMGHVTRVWPGK
ncbi:MAG TPA: 5-(carboxyamino)imidazole ribonucleotide synthase [Pseudolabrys sp.]|uniref:5-(carboxyamino)imidazole ribonucleotide synthase n=1 Tax=Pseudolabrys sp. TaxID=1960880 RepID=UPI002DDD7971|nr:5-(carboxyamino)imidazole ribonucleotide synthase [Pseudolabrys sp.]HEV2631187.1 5-(carboxyamino)imidazole ribonucleotide synthase [Pseudolabrys sp.]